MEIPEINKKYLGIGIIIIIVLIFLLFLPSFFKVKTINAYFSPSAILSPGQSTNLMIEIRNTLGKDALSASLSVKAIDNKSAIIGEFQQPPQIIEKDQWKKIVVPVSISEGTIEGSYSIEITVTLNGKTEQERVSIEVRKV